MPRSKQPLTDKQQRFVTEYLVDLNATAAAGRAGYKGKNLGDIGAQLLSKTHVGDAIRSAKDKRSKRTELSAAWVVKHLRIEATRRGEGASHSARVKAIELLGKHIGLLVEKHEHSGPGGKPIEIAAKVTADELAAARERAAKLEKEISEAAGG